MPKPTSPPPPPPRRRASREMRGLELSTPESADNEQAETNGYTLPLLLTASCSLCLLLVFCAGGIGAAVALRSTGTGEGEGAKNQFSDSNLRFDFANDIGAASNEEGPENEKPASPHIDEPAETAEEADNSSANAENETDLADPTQTAEENSNPGGTPEEPPEPEGGGGMNIPGATFFGISSTGERVIYVVDCSWSMEGVRFSKAKAELLRSIRSLRLNQKYMIIFFADGEFPMYYPTPAKDLVEGSDQNLARTERWVRRFSLQDGTNPTLAMRRALSFRPDSIFLLTDGEFESSIPDLIRSKNTGGTQINTISFIERDGEQLLKQIARDSGGVYRHIP